MNNFNPNLHHRRSVRLRNYDYSRMGLYFITICVQNKECIFGKILNGIMFLNEIGEIVRDEWLKTAELRKNVQLHDFVVMPNHFHGILEITEQIENNYVLYNNDVPVGAGRALPEQINETRMCSGAGRALLEQINETQMCSGARRALLEQINETQMCNGARRALLEQINETQMCSGAGRALPLRVQKQRTTELPETRFQNIGKNTLSSIVGSFKSAVTKNIHNSGYKFVWQRNLWEHIIQNYDDYSNISHYIKNNPLKWNTDKFYIE